MYQALYRKYRPNNFNEIAGQQVIVKTLKNAILNDRLSHAYLFTGPRGTGKTSIAKIVAKTINCERLNDFVPCDNCKSCLEFISKNNVDIIEIDAASNNGVDEIREIRNKIDLVPSFSKYKVYIIDEVHMLTQGAFNALLKTLEEPPKHIIFILATTEPHKIPNTILSRCQRFDFKRITNADIVERLSFIAKEEKINVSSDVFLEIARLSDGGLRDSISLFDQVISYAGDNFSVEDVHEVNGTICNDVLKSFVEDILNLNFDNVFLKISDYSNKGKNLGKIVESTLSFIKNILLSYEAPSYLEKNGYTLTDYNCFNADVSFLTKCIYIFNECITTMRKSNNPQLSFEMAILSLSDCKNEIVEKEKINNFSNNKQKEYNVHKQSKDYIIFKKIRVDNTLSKFNKLNLKKIIGQMDLFKKFVLDNKYGKWASIVLDGCLKAASDEYLIFVYDNIDMSNMFNDNFEVIEDLVVNVLSEHYKVVSVSLDEWEDIRNMFNSKQKKYNYVDEGNQFYSMSLKQNSDDEIAMMFQDVVEYK